MNFKLEVRVYLKFFLSYHECFVLIQIASCKQVKLYGSFDKITKDDA